MRVPGSNRPAGTMGGRTRRLLRAGLCSMAHHPSPIIITAVSSAVRCPAPSPAVSAVSAHRSTPWSLGGGAAWLFLVARDDGPGLDEGSGGTGRHPPAGSVECGGGARGRSSLSVTGQARSRLGGGKGKSIGKEGGWGRRSIEGWRELGRRKKRQLERDTAEVLLVRVSVWCVVCVVRGVCGPPCAVWSLCRAVAAVLLLLVTASHCWLFGCLLAGSLPGRFSLRGWPP